MTPPINIDGSTVDAVTIDGSSVSEVTVDGDTVFGGGPTVSAVIDDFEDGDISEYSGATGNATVQTSTVFNGTYALQFDTSGGANTITSTSGLSNYPSRGDTFQWYWRHSAGSTSSGMAFAVSAAPFGSNDAYTFVIRGDSVNSIALRRYDGGSRTTIATTNYDVPSGSWFKAYVDFQSTITCEVRDLNDNTLASISASDSNYDSGGIGWRLNDKTGSASTAYNDYAAIVK
jgi:hypothetical protein